MSTINPNASRLLDMLKSATSPPPLQFQAPSQQAPAPSLPPQHHHHHHQQQQQQGQQREGSQDRYTSSSTNSLRDHTPPQSQPQTGTRSQGSPREPSPSPPPPSLQAVSLSDLFASITSPPPPSGASSAMVHPGVGNGLGVSSGSGSVGGGGGDVGKVASPPVENDKRSKLLGMLNTLAPTSSASSSASDAPRQVNGGSAAGRTASFANPSLVSSGPASPNRPSQGLNNAKSPPIHITEPVISHPTQAPESTSGTQTPASDDVPPAVVSPRSNVTTSAPNGGPLAPAPVKKSPFDFVSPFSAFDLPSPSSKPVAKATPDVPKQTTQSSASASPAAAKNGPERVKGENTAATAAQDARTRLNSGVTSSNTSNNVPKDLVLPWQMNKVVQKGTEGKGPKQAQKPGVAIDLSQSNLDALVNSSEAVQVIPTTITKSENVGFSKGRSVGITGQWMAYILSRGRIRLIDNGSGARLVLQLPPRASQGPIIDIAVTSTSVAVIAADHSVIVFKVPQSWTRDDPHCDMVVYITPAQTEGDDDAPGLGPLQRLEWVEKGKGERYLAIGGTEGVVIVNPDDIKDRETVSMSEIASENKILTTEGSVVSFCLNASHQAIGLLSSNSVFTLYSMSNLNRVWNRKLPSGVESLTPSSVQFIENNILIGRNDNTTLELVQITVDLTVLATISFTAPPPSPSDSHFAQAVYDPKRTMLWVAPFARGSLFGFKYNLKGVHPAKASELPRAFDKYAEYPLDPVLSLVVGHGTNEDYADLFFATPKGFSLVHVQKAACDALTSPPSAPPPQGAKVAQNGRQVQSKEVASDNEGSKRGDSKPALVKQTPKKSSGGLGVSDKMANTERSTATPTRGNAPLPSDKEAEVASAESKLDAGQVTVSEDVAKALKRTESTLQNNFKQLLNNQLGPVSTRLDSLAGGQLAEQLSAKVERQLQGAISSIVQQEIKKSVLPSIHTSIQNELRSALATSVPTAVSSAMQNVPRDLERGLAAAVQRIVTSVVQSSVDRAVQEALNGTLLPAMNASSGHLADRLRTDFKSEMVQIRKDFSPPQHEPQVSQEPLLRALTSSVGDLQHKLAALSSQVSNLTQKLPTTTPATSSQPDSQLNDVFLNAMQAQSTSRTIGLVKEHDDRARTLLSRNTPLSQAVLLTLFHRIAMAINEMAPIDQNYEMMIQWLRRLEPVIDPMSPETYEFYPRVIPVINSVLQSTMRNIDHVYPGNPNMMRIMGTLGEIIQANEHLLRLSKELMEGQGQGQAPGQGMMQGLGGR